MKHRFTTHLTVLAAVALLLFGASQSFALGTAAGTSITNTASVEFTIGGSTPDPVDSAEIEFLVDRLVRMVVSSDGDNTVVVANVPNFAIPFTVTNESNTAAGSDYFQLTTEAISGTDDFDMTNVRIYLDADDSGTLNAGDTELATPYVQIGNGTGANSKHYLIVADAPNTAIPKLPGKDASYHLIATAWAGPLVGDGALVEDAIGANPGTNDADESEIVFFDDAGSATIDEDVAEDGKHSDFGTYTTLATLTIDKGVSNGGSLYHIPGDDLTYTITVTNDDPSNQASGVTIFDSIPTNTEFEGTLTCPAGFTAEKSDDNQTSWSANPAGTITDVRCYNGTVAAGGTTATMTFVVTIK